MKNKSKDLCEFLEWDSEFFASRIASVCTETVNESEILQILQWTKENKIYCLYFLANYKSNQTIRLLEKNNFHLVDIRVTLEKKISAIIENTGHSDSVVRLATPKDIDQLRSIASVNQRDSRFYFDGHFLEQKCDELFALWIEKSCQGFADAVFVTEDQNEIEGYITCSIDKQNKGNIGLLGVASKSQGKGVGKTLINKALYWFNDQMVKSVSVVTQGRNVKAQRLYQKNGFITESLKIWYHYWSNEI